MTQQHCNIPNQLSVDLHGILFDPAASFCSRLCKTRFKK